MAQASTPTFSPVSGDFKTTQVVTISSTTVGGTIFYTVDGSAPTHSSSSIANGGTVSVTQSTWLRAIETAGGFTDSSVGGATYVISPSSGSRSSEMGKPPVATRIESPETSIDGTNLRTKIIG